MQPGHAAPELHVPVRQPTVGSEGGKKEVGIADRIEVGEHTKGTRDGEIQAVLALSAACSWSISKQQSLCFIFTDSVNVSVSAPARWYL